MISCGGCGAMFEQPVVHYTDVGEKLQVCPFCLDYDLAPVKECPHCGGYFEEDLLTRGFCPACTAAVVKSFSRAVENLLDSFKPCERELIEYSLYE